MTVRMNIRMTHMDIRLSANQKWSSEYQGGRWNIKMIRYTNNDRDNIRI
jgi:hypothetical protein